MRHIIRTAAFAAILLAGAAAPAAAADGSASADNIVLDAGAIIYTISHIQATGTTLTDTDLAGLFDVQNPTPIGDRLARFTAATITIPEIDANETLGQTHVEIVYTDIKLTDVTSGRIGAASVAGATLTATAPDVGDLSGTYGAIEARNLDLALLARITTEARASADEPLQPLYDTFTIDSLRLTNSKNFNLSVGKMTGRDIRGRALSIPLVELTKMIATIKPGAPPDELQSKALAGFFTDVFSSFSIGSVEARDLTMDIPGDKPAKFTLGRLAIANFSDGKVGEISYEGLGLAGEDISVKLGTLALRGFDMRPLLQVFDTALAAGANGLDGLDPRRLLPTLDQIVLADIDFDVPDEKHTGNAANGARDQFQVGRLELDAANYLDGIPTAFASALDHLVVQMPANSADDNLKQFFALGYSGIDLSMRIDLAWNQAAQELSAKEISATLAGIGQVRLKATFGNVTEDLFDSDPAVIEAAALGAVLKNVDVFIENDGVAEKGIAAEARKEKKTPDQIRQMLVTGVAVGIPAALGNGPAAKAIGSAAAKFAAQPKTLHITASSQEGLGAADLALINQPADLLGKIDVTATANE